MRVIRFRAWDKLNERMIYIFGFIQHGTEIRIWYLKDAVLVNESFNEGNIILMQYTGLKDKNGKEIYEGDIIKLSTSNYIWQTVYDSHGFSIKIMDKGYEDMLPEAFFPSFYEIEILGNVYENHELLKEPTS